LYDCKINLTCRHESHNQWFQQRLLKLLNVCDVEKEQIFNLKFKLLIHQISYGIWSGATENYLTSYAYGTWTCMELYECAEYALIIQLQLNYGICKFGIQFSTNAFERIEESLNLIFLSTYANNVT
jgi:hypothetical protein